MDIISYLRTPSPSCMRVASHSALRILLSLLALASVLASGCAPYSSRSTYPSGWSNDTSERAYASCSVYHLRPDMPIEANLMLLVRTGRLTSEEANRVRDGRVRVGDSECAAFAAYGMDRSLNTFLTNKDHALVQREVTYRCWNSTAPCPGIVIQIVDGRVTDIHPLVERR